MPPGSRVTNAGYSSPKPTFATTEPPGRGCRQDLSDPGTPEALIRAAQKLGPVHGLVMSHCESVDSSILTTDLDSWDRHFAVNARATWLLIKAFAEQLPENATPGEVGGRVVALTSDHSVHNLPYSASKGALDRIVIAAAVELLYSNGGFTVG